jgi:transcription-repair coupling factor (superfamily II helicase)
LRLERDAFARALRSIPPVSTPLSSAAASNVLPRLLPEPPPHGQRARASPLIGSTDGLALAQHAVSAAERGELVAIVCAEALAVQRLAAEIPWFAPGVRVSVLSDWETLPYDHLSPHQDLVSERLATLYHASRGECDVLLVAATTALYRLAPPAYLAAFTFFIAKGEKLDLAKLQSQLALGGYQRVTQVVSPGEYSLRGGLIDLFPMGSALPYRIDLLDDAIESIKSFDVDTQRSVYPVPSIRLLPAREFPQDEGARTRFRGRYREVFEGDPSKSPLYRDVSNGVMPGGIEYYLPLFFEATATLADYLPPGATVCLHGSVDATITEFWRDCEARFRLLRGDPARPLLPPPELFLPADEFHRVLKPFARIELPESGDGPTQPLPPIQIDRRAGDPLHALKRFATATRERVLIVAESLGRRETMQETFAEYGFKPALTADWNAFLRGDASPALAVGPLHEGFVWPEGGVAVITEAELYANVVRRAGKRDARRSNVDAMLRDLSEVRIGDPVVHEQHGIGRYLGLTTLDLGDGPNEFLHLAYANDAKLYVPVSSLHVVSRYSGAAPEAAPLHELGSGQWDRAKRKAALRARDTAAELLNLYAQRAAREGHAFRFDIHDYEAFAAGFPFEETPDQAGAIEAVIKDLVTGKPMDRLVCGDVGFGKTEVALRAAFIAMADGKQVALLVPTTLLAEQHFQTFSDRFAELPVKLAELSRFRSGKEVKSILEGLAQGRIDLVIGTHRLIQSDVKFKQLGLVIIDEEHRFGVRHKEQLKKLRAEVDVLTLTATPIPRTLALSLEGLRDFSVIATAPERRLAIKTFVAPYTTGVVREAVLRELKRGGQVYYLHNEIDTIATKAERLTTLVPEARLAIAHGQMPERELERVMRDFYQQRCNLLLCSTIIESGIDVPTANTIIIDRADRFGLAQLHQLRGRVGRSHHQAYAYLLTPPEAALSAQAKKRLEAIQLMEELGSGFYLAMHDLEIRGAGEVLGEEQSGEMQQIGFQLYVDMLKASVDALKAGREPDLTEPLGVTTEINLHVPALLPETYCSDVHERLVLYKRLANCESEAELTSMQEELIDRFGLPPEPAQALIASHRLRLAAKPLGVVKIDAGPERTQIQFGPKPPFDTAKLVALIQKDGRHRLAGPTRVRIERAAPALSERAALVREFLERLA